MPQYPDYVHRTLAEARENGQWQAHQADAAALCFNILASFPDCGAANDLVYEIFCDEWTIYDNRVAIARMIDEWDDRPHQQRRRLALSYRYMSRWEGKYEDERHSPHRVPSSLEDIAEPLLEGKSQLLEAYCMGDEECVNFAWPMFAQAAERARNPQDALMWIGETYADLGFFADAVEVLAELCARFDDEKARRLLAEVRWWRDNAYCVPWIPPPGDGSRYRRIMGVIHPDAPSDEEVIQGMRDRMKELGKQPTWKPAISPEVAALIPSELPSEIPPSEPVVDWSYLDQLDPQTFAGEVLDDQLPKSVRWMVRRGPEEMKREIRQQYYRIALIPQPATPKRYDPNEPMFDALLEVDEDDEDDDEMDDLDDLDERDEF